MPALVHKKIVLGITGAIAAYKSAELCRRLCEAGAEVRVVMTDAAKAFITPLTMQAVSSNPISESLFDPNAEAAMGHIELARWADVLVIAPASADFVARMAHGLANDLLSTLCLATLAKIVVAPSMNEKMWHHSATQTNLHLLRERGVRIVGPAFGEQACGDIGVGRMTEPVEILNAVDALFCEAKLAGTKVLITAGPTREYIDPVRYISNCSSGKMGFALAQAALELGAEVMLVSGPTVQCAPKQVTVIKVNSTQEMFTAVMAHIHDYDIFMSAAAPADYRVEEIQTSKIKKSKDNMTIALVRNPDILAAVAKTASKPFTVGFAAETDNLLDYARQKLQNKGLDLVIANQVGQAGTGFESDQNACTIIWQDNQITLPLMPKSALAHKIMEVVVNRYATNHQTKNTESKDR